MKKLCLAILTLALVFSLKNSWGDTGESKLFPVRPAQSAKYGYMDSSGKIVIQPRFDDALPFSDGLALVKQNDKFGFIDETGKFAIKPFLTLAQSFSEGLAPAQDDANHLYGYINKKGQFVIKHFYVQSDSRGSFKHGVAQVIFNHKWIYIDKSGKEVRNPGPIYAEGLALKAVDRKWGYVNKRGTFIIKPHFDYALPFSEGLAVVSQNGKYGYIGKTGKFVIAPRFDGAAKFSGGIARVGIESHDPLASPGTFCRIGYISKSGDYIWDPKKSAFEPFSCEQIGRQTL